MNSFGALNNTCKNCHKNHFLYKKEYQCFTCAKEICKSCSYEPYYLKNNDKSCHECYSCFNKKSKEIRKMVAVENGIIREYNIANESNGIVHSPFFSEPDLAIEQLKHLSLLNGYNAITYLKIEKSFLDAKRIANFSGSKFKRYLPQTAYSASGILVIIEKQT